MTNANTKIGWRKDLMIECLERSYTQGFNFTIGRDTIPDVLQVLKSLRVGVAPAPKPPNMVSHTHAHRLSSVGEPPEAPQGRAEMDGKAGGDLRKIAHLIGIVEDHFYKGTPVNTGVIRDLVEWRKKIIDEEAGEQ